MDGCQVDGCTRKVSKAGHSLCLNHWKAERDGKLKRCNKCQRWHGADDSCRQSDSVSDESPEAGYLSSTRLGKHFGFSNIKMNLILAELGWIEKYVKGWAPTDRGNALKANVREMRNGTPYVVWPESILKNPALLQSADEQSTGKDRAPEAESSDDPLAKFPARFRAQDGHRVRSRAELLIDNWLYMQGIIHAYERRLPIVEDCYCDFYLPRGKVYIEYWGLDSKKYRDRKAAKQVIYAKHKLRLIELGDAEIERLDDVLPRELLRFGIESA